MSTAPSDCQKGWGAANGLCTPPAKTFLHMARLPSWVCASPVVWAATEGGGIYWFIVGCCGGFFFSTLYFHWFNCLQRKLMFSFSNWFAQSAECFPCENNSMTASPYSHVKKIWSSKQSPSQPTITSKIFSSRSCLGFFFFTWNEFLKSSREIRIHLSSGVSVARVITLYDFLQDGCRCAPPSQHYRVLCQAKVQFSFSSRSAATWTWALSNWLIVSDGYSKCFKGFNEKGRGNSPGCLSLLIS